MKFKVDDWVVVGDDVYHVHKEYNGNGCISEEVVNNLVNYDKSVKFWKPKEGEWCWIFGHNQPIALAKFREMMNGYIFVGQGIQYEASKEYRVTGTKCAPFIGRLPTLKIINI